MQSSTDKMIGNGKGKSYGSFPEVNGIMIPEEKPVDKYGFTGGAQQTSHSA